MRASNALQMTARWAHALAPVASLLSLAPV